MIPLQPKKPRTRSRLPQLSKSNRLAKRNGPKSEFLAMAEASEEGAQLRRFREATYAA